ncbi:kinesin-like protein KIF26A isoform X2 [Lampetra fluviatilis]
MKSVSVNRDGTQYASETRKPVASSDGSQPHAKAAAAAASPDDRSGLRRPTPEGAGAVPGAGAWAGEEARVGGPPPAWCAACGSRQGEPRRKLASPAKEPASGWADGRCEACSSCPGPPLDAGTAAAACLEHLPIGMPTHRPGPATPPQPSLPPHSQSQSPSSRGAKAQPPPPSSSSSAARATQSPAAVERKKGGSSSASVAGDGALTSPKMNGYAAHAYLGASPTLEGCKPLSGGSSWEQQSLGHPPLERLASPTRSPQALPWPLSAPGGSPAHGSPQKTAHAAPGSCAANSNCNGNGNPNASFFTRAAQKLSLTGRMMKRKQRAAPPHAPAEPPPSPGSFAWALRSAAPPVPPCLLRAAGKARDNPGAGKVKVMLRVCPARRDASGSAALKVDPRRKQVTLYDPAAAAGASSQNAALRRAGVAVPKIFPFDAVFSQDASQAEVCAGAVPEIIQSVVNGADGCIFCFGNAKLGKTYTMLGSGDSSQALGVAPCAISWLFRLIEERKERTGARFSVRVSAVEVSGRGEALDDLLSDVASGTTQDDNQSPGVFLREDPVCGTQLENQNELRASTAERAAGFLDAAVAARRGGAADASEEDRRNSHMLFTLHVYQYRMERGGRGGMTGGRSRLHLMDLGSCEKVLCKSREPGSGMCLSLSALGSVLLALANGAKHIPYRESRLTMLLQESLGNINCRTTMIAHVSASAARHAETLATVQLAARVHRLRKKKSRSASSSSGGDSSCEEGRGHRGPAPIRPFHPRLMALDPEPPPPASSPGMRPPHRLGLASEAEYSSSSEQSCDTVIYAGEGGDLTDNEGPPESVPVSPASSSNSANSANSSANSAASSANSANSANSAASTASWTAEGDRAPLLSRESEDASPVTPTMAMSDTWAAVVAAVAAMEGQTGTSPVERSDATDAAGDATSTPAGEQPPAEPANPLDRDHFKCKTFAELQERLDCIDGSEEPGCFAFVEASAATVAEEERTADGRGVSAGSPWHAEDEPAKDNNNEAPASPCALGNGCKARGKGECVSSEVSADKINRNEIPSCGSGAGKALGGGLACVPIALPLAPGGERGGKLGSPEKRATGKRSLPSPAPPPPQCRGTESTACRAHAAGGLRTRTPPVGMSPQVAKRVLAPQRPSPAADTEGGVEADVPPACVDGPFAAEKTAHRLDEESGTDDELVFTLDLLHALLGGGDGSGNNNSTGGNGGNGRRPISIISFTSNCSTRALAPGSRPVSFVSVDFEPYSPPPPLADTGAGAAAPAVSPPHSSSATGVGACVTRLVAGIPVAFSSPALDGEPFSGRVAGEDNCSSSNGSNSSCRSSIGSWLSELSNAGSFGSEGEQSCDSFVVQAMCAGSGEQGEAERILPAMRSSLEYGKQEGVVGLSQDGHSPVNGCYQQVRARTKTMDNIELNGVIFAGDFKKLPFGDLMGTVLERSPNLQSGQSKEGGRRTSLIICGDFKDISNLEKRLSAKHGEDDLENHKKQSVFPCPASGAQVVAGGGAKIQPAVIRSGISVHPRITPKPAVALLEKVPSRGTPGSPARQSPKAKNCDGCVKPPEPRSTFENPWVMREHGEMDGLEESTNVSHGKPADVCTSAGTAAESPAQSNGSSQAPGGQGISSDALRAGGEMQGVDRVSGGGVGGGGYGGYSHTLPTKASAHGKSSAMHGIVRLGNGEATSLDREQVATVHSATMDRKKGAAKSSGGCAGGGTANVFLFSKLRSSTPPAPPVRKSSLDQRNRAGCKDSPGANHAFSYADTEEAFSRLLSPSRGGSGGGSNCSTPARGKLELSAEQGFKRSFTGRSDSTERTGSRKHAADAKMLTDGHGCVAHANSASSRLGRLMFRISGNGGSSAHSTLAQEALIAHTKLAAELCSKSSSVFGSKNRSQSANGGPPPAKAAPLSPLSPSSSSSSSSKTLPHPGSTRSSSLPASSRAATLSRSVQALRSKLGRGTSESSSKAGRATNSRVSELACGSPKACSSPTSPPQSPSAPTLPVAGGSGAATAAAATAAGAAAAVGPMGSGRGSRGLLPTVADSDSGNDSGVQLTDEKPPPAGSAAAGGAPASPSAASSSSTGAASSSAVKLALPSPYSKVTAPRRPHHRSSGHGSDTSSVLSGEMPPAMGSAALFYCQNVGGGGGMGVKPGCGLAGGGSGGGGSVAGVVAPIRRALRGSPLAGTSSCSSSGYETGARQEPRATAAEGATAAATAAVMTVRSAPNSPASYKHESAVSDSGQQSSGSSGHWSPRSFKSLNRKALLGSQRRRLAHQPHPAAPPTLPPVDVPPCVPPCVSPCVSPARKAPAPPPRRVDPRPAQRVLNEPFEIKIYEIDGVQAEPFQGIDELLVYFSDRLKRVEERHQRLAEVQDRYLALRLDLEASMRHLMIEPSKWIAEFEVDGELDEASLEYLDCLERATERLQQRLNVCKSHIMIITCFDATR